jgi:serine/threonine protein kinase
MQRECPEARLAIAGQLMDKLPGNDLFNCIHGETVGETTVPKIDFTITEKPFQQIAYQLLKSMKVSMEQNFIHRDLKPENIRVIPINQEDLSVEIFDGGFSARGGKEKMQLHEPKGTSGYVSSRVYNAKKKNTYGAEADFYSTAMILLQMLDPKAFSHVINTRDTGSYNLVSYLTDAGPNSKIAQTLARPDNQKVRELIDLSFQASRGGEQGQKAYTQWQNAFTVWESTLQTNNVIPTAERVASTTSASHNSQKS